MTNQVMPRNVERTRSTGPSEVILVIKYLLFALNVLFWIVGLVMILIGVYAKTQKSLGEIGNTLPWYMDPANLFIIIGSIVFFLAFVGCIGSLRENVCLLRTFEYTIDVLLLLEVAIAVYVYVDREKVKKNVEDVLKDTISNYRDDPDLQSIMDWVQMEMQCCGVAGPEDWEGNIYFNCTNDLNKSGEKCSVPHSCCKDYKTELNAQCAYGIRKPAVSDVERSQVIYTDGCLQKTFDKFLNQDNLILLVCVGGAMVLLQLVTTGLAHHLVDGIRRQKSKWNQPNFRGNRESLMF